jgi:hypothetical protein
MLFVAAKNLSLALALPAAFRRGLIPRRVSLADVILSAAKDPRFAFRRCPCLL